MIRNNIFTHFAKPWGLIFTQMHGEKVYGVSNFVSLSRRIQTLSQHYKDIFVK